MKRLFFISLFGILLLAYCVYPAILRVPSQYWNIQMGIDAAFDGDTVLIADGVYIGAGNKNLDFGGRAIVVMSENGPDNCIIDCENQYRAFYFHTSEDSNSVVEGLSIINGYYYIGAGINCSSSSPTIKNCIIRNNQAHGG